ncbi:dihydroorotate dehydrogenase electron transfer subunit [Candidatus Woesearchaeota archaeon]|nr:dihydroorotate dehydrogenase electron transfer subunit [Candidatus Woesearchaeota archaeon]
MKDFPKTVAIKRIIKENYKVKTFYLDIKLNAKPGQFVMVWVPGVDEKPFTLSSINPAAITVEEKGKFTKKLFAMKKGDLVGVRGPYGKGFSVKSNACIVAGGLGVAPLLPLIEKLKNPEIIFGVKTKKDLMFNDKLKGANLCTDDGCVGFKGFTSELLEDLLKKKKYGIVYTCGPEVMIKAVFDVCEKYKVNCEASLERFMKCGFGICGQCAIDDQLVCKDGPVFNSEQIRKLTELGKFARLKSGRKVPLKEYYAWRSE